MINSNFEKLFMKYKSHEEAGCQSKWKDGGVGEKEVPRTKGFGKY
jgi:hypothetical protein